MTSPSRKGDIAELMAVLWLVQQGFEVFENFGSSGPVDIIAINLETNEITLIDVKKLFTYVRADGTVKIANSPKGKPAAMKTQIALGVRYLLVDIDTGECRWKEPEGL